MGELDIALSAPVSLRASFILMNRVISFPLYHFMANFSYTLHVLFTVTFFLVGACRVELTQIIPSDSVRPLSSAVRKYLI